MGAAPLTGIRVIDLTQNVAGPFCTQILADLGAEVIKIERPGCGDDTRQWRPPEVAGQSSTFLALNRSKLSVAIDINHPDGQDMLREMVQSAQIVIHSLKPGSAERRGLGYADLRTVNPRIIYCALSAFGQQGPLARLPGYDPLLQAFSGIMSVTGSEGAPPVRVGVSLVDIGTGMWSALGIVTALLKQRETGEGALVETSLLETAMGWMTIPAAGYFATGVSPKRLGSSMSMTAPYELFQSRDGHVFIGAGNDRLFAAACAGLGADELARDTRFLTNPLRVKNRQALHDAMEAITRELPSADIVERMRRAGAPCSEMNDVETALGSAQVTATGIVQALPIDEELAHRTVGLPLQIDGQRGTPPSAPPALGEHSDSILAGIGLSPERIENLRGRGIIG